MAGWLQSLLAVVLISAGGLTLRLFWLLGSPPVAFAISAVAGVVIFGAAAILLGLAIAAVGMMI